MILLLVLHHLADAGLQPSWLIRNKSKHLFAIYEHSVIWAGLISLGLWALHSYSFRAFMFLLIGHFIIDAVKYKYCKNYNWIYLDQALHYLQIIIAYKLV